MDCSVITAGLVAAQCDKAPVGGTAGKVYIVNFADIDKDTSVVTKNVISSLVLKDGKNGFAFESLDDSTLGEFSANVGTYFSNWQHDVTLRIFAKSQEAKNFLDNSLNARVVLVVENRESGETKFECYGWDSGLKISEVTGSTEVTDGIVYSAKFSSTENSRESSLPKSVFVTSEEATRTMLEALLPVESEQGND